MCYPEKGKHIPEAASVRKLSDCVTENRAAGCRGDIIVRVDTDDDGGKG